MKIRFISKLTAVIFCLVLVLSITACSKTKETTTDPEVVAPTEAVIAAEPTLAPTLAPTQAPEPVVSETTDAVITGTDVVFHMNPDNITTGWTAQVDSGWVLGDLSKSATIGYTAGDSFYSIKHTEAGFEDKVYVGFGEDLDITGLSAITVYLKGTPETLCIKAANKSWTGTDYEWLTHDNENGDHYAVTGVTSTAYPEYKAYTIDVSNYAPEKIGGLLIGDFNIEGNDIDVALTVTLTYGSTFTMDADYVTTGWTSQVDSGWVLGDLSKTATIGYTAGDLFYSINHADAGFEDKVYVGFGEDLDLTGISAITVYLKGTPETLCIKAANMSFTGTDYEWLTHDNENGDHYAITGVTSTAFPEYKAYTIDVSNYVTEKIGGLLIGDFDLEGKEIDVALAVTLTYGSTFTMDPDYVATGWTSQVDSGWVLGDLSKTATISYTAGDLFYSINHADAGFEDKVYVGFGEDLDLTGISAITVYLKGTPETLCIKAANKSWTGTDFEWLTHDTESGNHFAITGIPSTAYPGYIAYTIDVSNYAPEKIGGLLIGDFDLEGKEIDVALTVTCNKAK